MTIAEFKAFLDGMDVKETPTKEQWARIAEKIDQLEAISTEYNIPKIFPNNLYY